ncbi:MAG: hypothetical protein H6671_09090 [Anaerolineaceae bacterium]|nr:hypothetical protein [Anaerolineaceae bacterium]
MTVQIGTAFNATVYDDQWRTLASRQVPCCGMILSPDGDSLLVQGETTEIWDVDTLQTIRTLSSFIANASWSPDGSEIASFNYGPPGGMKIYSAIDGHLLREFTRSTATAWAWPYRPQWSPNGAYFVTVAGNQLVLLDAATGLQVGDNHQLDGDIYAYSWSSDSTRIAIALRKQVPTQIEGSFPVGDSVDGYALNSIVVFEISSGNIMGLRNGFRYPVYYLVWSPDDRQIATWLDNNLIILDSATGNVIDSSGITPAFSMIAYSSDGGRLLMGLASNIPYDPTLNGTPVNPVVPRSTFAKTELDGLIQILAPAASPERLQSILAACSDDSRLQSSADALISAGQYQEFVTLVDASTTLPAACAADLRLMAEALASE